MISRVRSYAGLLRDPEVKPLLVILGIALVVQVIYFVRIQALYPPYGLTTEHYYSPLAQNLLHHGTYGFGEPPEIERSTTRPPFYSVVLAGIYGAFGENEAFALVFNNIVLFSTIIVVYMIGRTFSPKIGLLASLLFVLDPVSVINANKNQAEAVFTLLMALFILVTLRAYTRDVSVRVIVLSSLILGLATMTRAVSLYLWIPVLVSFFVAHRWLIRALPLRRTLGLMTVFFVIQGAIIGGWMARNSTVYGNPEFASEQGMLFYSYLGPLVVARATGVPYEEVKTALVAELVSNREKRTRAELERYRFRKGLELVLEHPLTTATVYLEHIPTLFLNYPVSAATIFFSEDRRESIQEFLNDYAQGKSSRIDVSGYLDVAKYLRDGGLAFMLVHAAFFKLYYLLLMLSVPLGLGLLMLDKERRPTGVLFLTFVGYLVFIAGFWATARFRMPMMPAFAVMTAYFLVWLWALLAHYRQRGIPRLRNLRQPAFHLARRFVK